MIRDPLIQYSLGTLLICMRITIKTRKDQLINGSNVKVIQ
jgi:hypothetical protein